MPFCDQCGRRLEPDARFCDRCGRRIAFEEAPLHPVAPPQAPPSYEIVLGEGAPQPSAAAREPSAVGEKAPEAQVESKPREWPPPAEPRRAQRRPFSVGRFRVTRRALALSLAGVVAIVIVAFALLGGPIVLPPLTGTTTETTSQTVTTQATGPVLHVEIIIAKDPVSAGSTQVIGVVVRDPDGNAISDASVRVEVLYPSARNVISEGVTNTYGQYSYAWNIEASADSVGTFKVTVSATKAGYQPGHAQDSFQATPAPG